MPVERLSLSDIDAIEAIEQASYPDPWSRDMLASAWTGTHHGGIKWVSDGRLCGYLITLTVPPEMEILNIAVSPHDRRRGIARKMMARVLDEGRRQGCTEAFLEVRISNSAAIKLYECFGFSAIRMRRKYYRDGEDALVMRAKLA